MPHLILERTKDDASNHKTIARLLDQWINLDIDSLFPQAKTIRERISKTKQKRSVDENKKFEKHISTEKFPMPFDVLQKKQMVVFFL